MNAGEQVAQAADPHAGHGAPKAASGGAVTHKASGVVRAISGDELFIQHGAIQSAGMGAMTMGFKAPRGGVPKDVKVGTRVDFEFVIAPSGQFETRSVVPSKTP
jgi:Cu(I)/Ag(I) efflux system membrane fusion protein